MFVCRKLCWLRCLLQSPCGFGRLTIDAPATDFCLLVFKLLHALVAEKFNALAHSVQRHKYEILKGFKCLPSRGARAVAGHCLFMSPRKAASGRPQGHNALGRCCDRRACLITQVAWFDVSVGADLEDTVMSGRCVTAIGMLAVEPHCITHCGMASAIRGVYDSCIVFKKSFPNSGQIDVPC